MVIQGAILAVIMILLKDMFATAEMKTALILYLFLPPTFVIPAYAKNGREWYLPIYYHFFVFSIYDCYIYPSYD